MNEIYIFLDWAMTISKLIDSNAINEEKFDKFFCGLQQLEKAFNGKVKLCIVSGTAQDGASKRNGLIKDAFIKANRDDIFQGVAYEYGGYFIDVNNKNHCVNSERLADGDKNKVLQLAKKYDLGTNPEYNLYLSFYSKNIHSTDLYDFYKECKMLNGVSIVYYDDQEGVGCDIKNPKLNKGAFVKWFLQYKHPKMIIVGGDDKEDISMIVDYPNVNTYFVGFADSDYNEEKSAIKFLSEFDNVDGIVDNFEAIVRYSLKDNS